MAPQKEKYAAAIAIWQDWNSKINVISRKDTDNIFEHHILHSLAILRYLEIFYPEVVKESFLDVGTGGGFPGIPLAMEMPGAEFTLVDSVGKKVKVAQAVADSLGLGNVRCINARMESVSGEWDWVVSRAVTTLEAFYPWVKGKFRRSILYLKGGDVNAEIATLLQKYHLSPQQIRTWRISNWLDDEYFAEKFVIEIGKTYLCSPFNEK